ncbi:MAG TPA: hypothetical protein ENI87_14195 [bacterium]|nr:hypothetical protein [bacterium]
MLPRPSGIVTLTTDFGVRDPYVGVLEGALLQATSKPRVVHLCHEVPPHDVAAGAFVLWSAIGRFPSGSVHVGVVDPGVGSERALLAVAAHDQYWLGPDNGLLGSVLAGATAAEVRTLDLDHLRVRRHANTFDGREVLAPVAAMLAAGRYGFSALGPRAVDCDHRDPLFDGEDRVVHVDRFGNLITNVKADRIATGTVVGMAGRQLGLGSSYSDVGVGELLAYVGSFGLLEVAAREARADELLGVGRGARVSVAH